MRDLKHARMLFKMAGKDLKALEGMIDEEFFDDEIFGFHAQQAVEKTLKAWLSLVGAQYHRIHDLEELFALLGEHGAAVPERFFLLIDLTDFAIQFRYESFEDFGDGLDRNEIICQVTELVEYVAKLLETDPDSYGEDSPE